MSVATDIWLAVVTHIYVTVCTYIFVCVYIYIYIISVDTCIFGGGYLYSHGSRYLYCRTVSTYVCGQCRHILPCFSTSGNCSGSRMFVKRALIQCGLDSGNLGAV